MKIGIPRTLTYYAYYPLWESFFKELGCDIVVSDKTSKVILDDGVQYAVNDACIPIKLFHGHVHNLKNKADYIFVPRLMNYTEEKTVTYCPKFLGLADMIRASMDALPPLLDIKIDMREKRKYRREEFERVAALLKTSPRKAMLAFQKARLHLSRYNTMLSGKLSPDEALKLLLDIHDLPAASSDPLSLAVVGYPYLLYDEFISAGLIKKLLDMGVRVLTPEMVPPRELNKAAKALPKDLFWTFSNQVVRSSIYYLQSGSLDGIIHVTAFGCGPDSMVDKLIELEAKQRAVPFICVSLDEHTGEAGVLTRLEAFVDMLEFRRDRK
ncbi:MAG: Activator of (R)-2-hydroxyglutaryl-CoA dehydratase [Firmicutes bacterium]|nr:Activator of (R)-2-hydroxyglutaryl-CoA dehydratase [Bacillota bacterium]MDI6705066.1 acyl-CoA dehydratase activase-related protein [Bacillota bacterium]